jgi:dipeptidyl aminopeptidase/acylaminoacyl peptidase
MTKVSLALTAFVLGGSAMIAKPDPALARTKPVPATEPVPVIDFFRPHRFRSPQLNPAGTHVASHISMVDDDRTHLAIYDIAADKSSGIAASRDRDVATFRWLDDRRVMFSISQQKRFAYGLFVADTDNLRRSRAINAYDVGQLIGIPRKTPTSPLVWIRHRAASEGKDGGVVQFDTNRELKLGVEVDGTRASATNDGGNIIRNFLAPKGTVVGYLADMQGDLAFSVTAHNGTATLHHWRDKQWQQSPADLDAIDIIAPGERTGEVLVLASGQAGKPRALQRYDAVAGRLGEVLLQDDEYDVISPSIHFRETDQKLVGVTISREGPRSIWWDPDLRATQQALDQTFPGWFMRIIDFDRRATRFLVHAMSDRHPGVYFLYDSPKKDLLKLDSAAPWIDYDRMRPMSILRYRSRDGHPIEGYLTVPAGASKPNPAPLVVLPHGGPWARDTWGWDPEAQLLASRGYLVFQPNYRGSTGYLWRFDKGDDWDFQKMHQDVTDGVHALLKSGAVDRQRIAIMGSSFGAYLALCGATAEPDLYRCAIGIAGVYDWQHVMQESRGDIYSPAQYGVLRRHLGDPEKQAVKFESISPLRHTNKIKIPVFIAHGTEDRIASVAQSKRLLREMKKHNVVHEVRIQRDEGHGFQHLDNQVALYKAIEGFLGRHVPTNPKPAVVPAGKASQ